MSNTRIRKGGKIKQCRLGPLASGAAAVVLFLKAEGNTVGGTKLNYFKACKRSHKITQVR